MNPDNNHNYSIERVEFHGQELWAAVGADPTRSFLAVPPIVQHLGLDLRNQRRKIQRHPLLAERSGIFALPTGQGVQETLALRFDAINFYLATIQPRDVRRDIAKEELLLSYQRECADVLFAHFFRTGHAVLPAEAVQVVPLLREIKRGVDAIQSKQEEHNRDTEERELLQDTRLEMVEENQHLAAIRAQEDRERDVAAQTQQAQMAGNVLSIRDVQDQTVAPTVKAIGQDAEEILGRSRFNDSERAQMRVDQRKRYPRKSYKYKWREEAGQKRLPLWVHPPR